MDNEINELGTVTGVNGVEFTLTDRDLVPTVDQLTELDAKFQSECPTGYEKVMGYKTNAQKLLPRNCYQHDMLKLSPVVYGYQVDDKGEILNIGCVGASAVGWTPEEKATIQKLADENNQFAFHQREV